MKHIAVINPAAGKKNISAQTAERFREAFSRQRLENEILITTKPGEAKKVVLKHCESGGEYSFYAAGGDGTLNEVLCGMYGYENARLTHYPSGSGNDFIKCFGMDKNRFLNIDSLIGGREVLVDTLDCGEYKSINIATTGIDAKIAQFTQRIKRLPLIKGPTAYQISVIYNIIKGIGYKYKVEIDGESRDGEYMLIAAANANYYGSGYYAVPDARFDDGLIDILLAKKISRLKMASVINIYKRGGYKKIPEVFEKVRGKDIKIRSETECPFNFDGEIVTGREISIKMSEYKVRFVIPQNR